MLETWDGKVCEGSCLVALFSHDSNTDMGCLDHVHIVETITNRQHALLVFEMLFDEAYSSRLLLW